MKSHLIAFGGAAQDYSAGLVTMPFIADPLFRASSNVVQLNDDWRLLWSFAGGDDLTRVRLSSAKSRLRGYPNLPPFTDTHLAGSDPNINDLRDFPLALYAGENVTIQATNAASAAAVLLLSLSRGEPNYNINVSGLRKIRFTSTVTSIAYGWSNEGDIVLDDDLDPGLYNIYGLSAYEADGIAIRLVLDTQVERPGVVMGQLVSDRPWEPNMGGLGLFGSFNTVAPPKVQTIHVAAASQTITGYMLIGKAGN